MNTTPTNLSTSRVLVASEPSDLYVVFGTGHQAPDSPLVPTRKHFETPLGLVETDNEFVADVSSALGDLAPFDQELLHLKEQFLVP